MTADKRTTPKLSRTSIYVAAGRAIGAREPDVAVRNPDYLAERLLGDPAQLEVDHPVVRALSLSYDEAMQDPEVVNVVRMMLIRTRFVDAALERAIAAGATQVLVLGAGFDTHAYRCQHLLADAQVFEVDRPATQALKEQRVLEAIGTPPANLTYVSIDIEQQDVREILVRHGYDPTKQTFVILEGVTMYLPEEGLRRALRFLGSHSPGSTVVFDFVYRALVDMIAKIDMNTVPEAAKAFVKRFLDLTRNEPWVFGIPMGTEREFLAEFNLDLREILPIGGEESLTRYVTKADGTRLGEQTMAEAMRRWTAARQQTVAASSENPSPKPEPAREQPRAMSYHLAEAVVAAGLGGDAPSPR
jgi:methyltransferase (TIGR00027 family)